MIVSLEERKSECKPLPRAAVFENSEWLLSKFKHTVFRPMKRRLEALGYTVVAQVVDTMEHGIPQATSS